MKFKSILLAGAVSASLLAISASALAESYMPFVLGTASGDSVSAAATSATASLKENGFEVVGTYEPNSDAQVIIVTNHALKDLAAKSKNGGFGAMERVSVVKRGGVVEVSYTNPTYMWNMYRMKGDISGIQSAIEKALGKQKEFGAEKALSVADIREYHYKFMMPYFDDVDELAEHDSQSVAADIIEANLTAGKAGTKKIYRIDIPGSKMTVFGVAMTKGDGADAEILKQIDANGHSHAAHLPYEILVNDGEVVALNAKFRIAINWPSLSMMGSGSFMSIADSPEAITETLTEVASE
jgi:hypothetical protein